MNIIETARAGILEQPPQRLQKIMWAIIATIACATGILIWSHISTISSLQQQLKTNNTYRRRAQKLVSRYQRIQKQKQSVDAVLEKDPNFKIKEYMNKLINDLQFDANTVTQIDVGRPRDVQSGYTEVSLDVSFTGINTKQLVTLMHESEKNERVYIKSVTINKQKQAQKIDATLTVATLHKKES